MIHIDISFYVLVNFFKLLISADVRVLIYGLNLITYYFVLRYSKNNWLNLMKKTIRI